jgi:glutathione S-transferase
MPILHQMPMSGNCYKIRLAAAQLGIPLTLKDYPLHDGLTRKADFLSKNPNGRVPLLEFEDGRTLAESGAILWHISEGSKLQPADSWGRAQALQWMFFEQYSHEPYIAVARFIKAYGTTEIQQRRKNEWPMLMERGNAALSVMETHLSENDWFAGDRYSIADIALYGYTHAAEEGGFDLSRYPAVTAWLKRVAEQPGHTPMWPLK